MENVLVFGGDGYLGWPLSLGLSDKGYNVTVVDNFSTRGTFTNNLTGISKLEKRIETWTQQTGKVLEYKKIDIARNFFGLKGVIQKTRPDVIVLLAEKTTKGLFALPDTLTFENNLRACYNVLLALVESDILACRVYYFPEIEYSFQGSFLTNTFNSDIVQKFEDLYKGEFPKAYFLNFGEVWGVNTDLTGSYKDLFNRLDCERQRSVIHNTVARAFLKIKKGFNSCGVKNLPLTHIQDFVYRTIEVIGERFKPALNLGLETETLSQEKVLKHIYSAAEGKKFYRENKNIVMDGRSLREIFDILEQAEFSASV